MVGVLKNSMSKGTEEEGEDDEAIEDTTCRQQMQKQPTAMLWENNDPYVPVNSQ